MFNFKSLYDLVLGGFHFNLVYDLVYGWYMLGIKNEPKKLTMIENVRSDFSYPVICVVWEKTAMACYKAFCDTTGLCDIRGYKK